mmetsp:Transcript_3161/g.8552  ORF Transcript_3161/g.8552 Transcript_3161/m.8552 type:complete len:331 (+) Transcript_3161:603-1595(+)
MVPPHPVDVPGERREICPGKGAPAGGDALVEHSVVVLVEGLRQQVKKIVQKVHVVVVLERLEKVFFALVRRDEQRGIFREEIGDVAVDLVGVDPGLLVLEVAPPNVHRVVGSRLVSVLPGFFADGVHDRGGRALDGVDVPEVVPDVTLRPKVLLPVLEEHENVEMNQKACSGRVVPHEVNYLGVLHRRVVHADFLPEGELLVQAVPHLSVDPPRVPNVALEEAVVLLVHVHFVVDGLHLCNALGTGFFGKDGRALAEVPGGGHSHSAQPFPEFSTIADVSIPFGSVPGGKDGLSIGVLEEAVHDLRLQKFLHPDYLDGVVLVGNRIEGKE